MTGYSADAVVNGLKWFQRRTVDHVMQRFFGPEPTRRFLIADETGLGKSVMAGAIVAKTIETLQHNDEIDRIDVLYVCSNQDIAKQNTERLTVAEAETVTLATRLTLLARDIGKLQRPAAGGKPVNLVAFTPGTSFDQGNRGGRVEERALLYLMLREGAGWRGWKERSAARALQGTVSSLDRILWQIDDMEARLDGPPDPRIHTEFRERARQAGLIDKFDELTDDIGRRATLPWELQERCRQITSELRAVLAQAGVEALEPDLIILDEFQRFRRLIDPNDPSEAAELARTLFDYRDARVLLLSATPYKPMTYADETEDHYHDFRQLLDFLSSGDVVWLADVDKAFSAYRDAITRGRSADDIRHILRDLLLRYMCRTERPAAEQDGMLREKVHVADQIRPAEAASFAAMRMLATKLGAPMTVEYWKSAPYFLNFTEGYKLGEKIRAAADTGYTNEIRRLLEAVPMLDPSAVDNRKPIDLGNSRLRHLVADTVDQGWWKLLWLPPSMPHYALEGPFADAAREQITKRLVFSSWNATPTAVAGLLSYEVERHIGATSPGESGVRRLARLEYRVDGDRPAAMSALALFWPHPALAALCDPLASARRAPESIRPLAEVEAAMRESLLSRVPPALQAAGESEPQPWQAYFQWPGALPNGWTLGGGDASGGLDRHITLALDHIANSSRPLTTEPAEVIDDVLALGMHGPGNIAWRALERLVGEEPVSAVTPHGHWLAARRLAEAVRTLFNHYESALLLDRLDMHPIYWQAVLRYCASGGLQAVLDEQLHTLRSSASHLRLSDDSLMGLASQAAGAIEIRPSTYAAFDPFNPDEPIKLPGRFALRYGGKGEMEATAARQGEVRNAFNSPFWPFVVATTSAGQEGIDFHQWCSAVVHWNTPANPVDFEQREGRVHRFGGHAIRRNIAEKHRPEALRSGGSDVWKAAYDAAHSASDGLDDFAPYWVYPGPAMIERHVYPYPLSSDLAKLERLRVDLATYRLAFGQPRQEDMLELVRRSDIAATEVPRAVDLRP